MVYVSVCTRLCVCLRTAGKTLLARAVAHHTDCTFIRVSGAELVQKYIGEVRRRLLLAYLLDQHSTRESIIQLADKPLAVVVIGWRGVGKSLAESCVEGSGLP
jgi:ATP-dependent Zn protease